MEGGVFGICCGSNSAVVSTKVIPANNAEKVQNLSQKCLSPSTQASDDEVALVNMEFNKTQRRSSEEVEVPVTPHLKNTIVVDKDDPNPFKKVYSRRSRENSLERSPPDDSNNSGGRRSRENSLRRSRENSRDWSPQVSDARQLMEQGDAILEFSMYETKRLEVP